MTHLQPSIQSLQVAMDANATAYRRSVQTSAPGECWDFVVLTAANEKQAQGYRQELQLRHRAIGSTGAFFPAIQRSVVVADPPGGRIGSGGATLGVMRTLADQFGVKNEDYSRLRILLIHSGGASQRLPMYSPIGKIFAPLPLLRPDGQIATLFDHLYLTLAGLPERLGPGMLILAGDVFLLLDHRQVTTPPPGVCAISMRVEAELGRGHGVFVADESGRIQQTLQKVSVDAMQKAGATDERGQVLIDTGLLFFDAQRTATLAKLAGAGKKPGLHQRHRGQIDLYEDMTLALASGVTQKQYLDNPAIRPMRRELWKTLHGTRFSVMQLDGHFLHLGTTLQFRDAMVGQNQSPAAELFQQDVLAHSDWPMQAGRRVYHSVLLGNNGSLGNLSVVEHSILQGNCTIGDGSVVSQVIALQKPITLAENLLLFQVPVRDARGKVLYVQVLCGVSDDFKGLLADGKCVYLNKPVQQWLTSHHVKESDLWPGVPKDKRTLWTARLFVATPQRDSAHTIIAFNAAQRATPAASSKWRKLPRYSMAMMLEQADSQAAIEHREIVSAHLQGNELLNVIRKREDIPVESLVNRYQTAAAYEGTESILKAFADQVPTDADVALNQARALWCAAQLAQRPDRPDPITSRSKIEPFMSRAFVRIADASEIGHRGLRERSSTITKISPNLQITAAAPVRLDLAGGWSDTPPYCFERGGQVVNVSINLDGRPPVRAIVRTLREPKLILESHDLGQTIEFDRTSANHVVDVRDPFALHKVALAMTGLLPGTHTDVRKHLKTLGAGIHVTTECRVPKGSGLGTSSILAACVLGALHRLRDHECTHDEIIEETLVLEQRLSTGGGWQDQVGGIFGGIKSIISPPGIPQRPVVEQLALSDEQFRAVEQRLVVYYSGQQRLARDILRRVMGRWLAREPAIVVLEDELKSGAVALRQSMLGSDWTDSARHIARYWAIKKELYPGSTTPSIDVLLLELRSLYLAAGLAGAGGGGFAYFFCNDAQQAQALREKLAERSSRPGSLGSVYETQINREGLRISVERA